MVGMSEVLLAAKHCARGQLHTRCRLAHVSVLLQAAAEQSQRGALKSAGLLSVRTLHSESTRACCWQRAMEQGMEESETIARLAMQLAQTKAAAAGESCHQPSCM